MEPVQLILLAVGVGLLVAAIAWFGPRRRQWRSHDLEPTDQAEPFTPLTEASPDDHPDDH